MEAFNDLQRNWAKRFPHSKLSLIWEEDVRTLLSTHRQRVAQLREELEQEEFLVQYFERYLSDAKRSTSRDKANNNSHNFADTNAGLENGDSASRNRNSNGVDGTCSNGLSDACATSSPGDKPPDSNYGKVRSAQSELAASQNKAAPQPPTNGDTDEHGKPYVTVIADSTLTSSCCRRGVVGSLRRRRPKRAKWPPPVQVTQLAQKEPCSPTSEPVAAPAVQNQPSPGTCEPNSTKNSATEPQPAFSTFKPPAGAGGALPNLPPSYQESVGTRGGLGETPATDDAADDQDGCDVIYDTVAFDDEGSSSKGADDEDHDVGISPEPDYVEFGKFERRGSSGPFLDEDRRLPLVSGSATTTSSSSATYENITLLKASESMDSEEDDGASILRSMSSDTELDHDAGTATTGSDHSGAGSGGRADRGKAEELLDVDSGKTLQLFSEDTLLRNLGALRTVDIVHENSPRRRVPLDRRVLLPLSGEEIALCRVPLEQLPVRGTATTTRALPLPAAEDRCLSSGRGREMTSELSVACVPLARWRSKGREHTRFRHAVPGTLSSARDLAEARAAS
ncbi:hypothetical protein HPB47_022419 [Ixodes persulcatus]|uniref:Uncharacterized protein n=1 Tax=Ixodes persulcatus TaxID=34615 RepID=A0AC60Q9S7_IXOPE|nr:hypothetical protein HPB47_022419 [Ixodes persulcatus]